MKYSYFGPFHFLSNRLWVFGSDKWNPEIEKYEPEWLDIRTDEIINLSKNLRQARNAARKT